MPVSSAPPRATAPPKHRVAEHGIKKRVRWATEMVVVYTIPARKELPRDEITMANTVEYKRSRNRVDYAALSVNCVNNGSQHGKGKVMAAAAFRQIVVSTTRTNGA